MKSLLIVIAIFLGSSCASIPDFQACGNLTRGRGFCTKVLSQEERLVDQDEWSRIKIKSVIVPAKDYGKVKAYIIKQCKRNDVCKEKYMPGLDGTFKKLDRATK